MSSSYNPRVVQPVNRRKDPTLQKVIKLHKKQFDVYKSKARFRTLVAGRRFGKSMLSMAEIIRASAKPNQDVWYVAPTYRMAKQIAWRDLKKLIPSEWVVKVNQVDMSIELANGTLISCKGAENYDSLRGVKLDFVVLDEFQLMNKSVWYEAIRPTLSTTGGRAIFLGTPTSLNHLYDMYKNGQDEKNVRLGIFESWQYKTADSPFIPPLEIEMAKKELDPKTFESEYLANFKNISGCVYYAFDRRIHVGDYPFDKNLPIWVGQDFNVDPMAAGIMQYHKEQTKFGLSMK